jgi:hypothetical protein
VGTKLDLLWVCMLPAYTHTKKTYFGYKIRLTVGNYASGIKIKNKLYVGTKQNLLWVQN